MNTKVKPKRRTFKEDFKREAVNLIVTEGYSFKAAAEAVNVTENSLRNWHRKFAPVFNLHVKLMFGWTSRLRDDLAAKVRYGDDQDRDR